MESLKSVVVLFVEILIATTVLHETQLKEYRANTVSCKAIICSRRALEHCIMDNFFSMIGKD